MNKIGFILIKSTKFVPKPWTKCVVLVRIIQKFQPS